MEVWALFPVVIHRILTAFSNAHLSIIIWMPTRLRPVRIKQILAPHKPCHIRPPVFRLSIWRIMPDAFWNFLFLTVKINCHRGYARISHIVSAFFSISNMFYINTHLISPPFPGTYIPSSHCPRTVSALVLPRGLFRPRIRQWQKWLKSVQQDDRHANRTRR